MIVPDRVSVFLSVALSLVLLTGCAGRKLTGSTEDDSTQVREDVTTHETEITSNTLVWDGDITEDTGELDVKVAGTFVDTIPTEKPIRLIDGNFGRLVTASSDRLCLWSIEKDTGDPLIRDLEDFSGRITALSLPRDNTNQYVAFGTTDGFYLYNYAEDDYLINSYEQIDERVKFFDDRFVGGVHHLDDGSSIVYVWSIKEKKLYKRIFLEETVSDFSIVITPIKRKQILSVILRSGEQRVYRIDRGPENKPPLLEKNQRKYLTNHDRVSMNLARGGFLIFSNPNGFYLFESRKSERPDQILEHRPWRNQSEPWKYVSGPTKYGSLLVPDRNNTIEVYALSREGSTYEGQLFGGRAAFVNDGSGVASVSEGDIYVYERKKLDGLELLDAVVRFKERTTDTAVQPLIRKYFPEVFGRPEITSIRYSKDRGKFLVDIVASDKTSAAGYSKTLVVQRSIAGPRAGTRLREQLKKATPRVIFSIRNRKLRWESASVRIDGRPVDLVPPDRG